MSHRTAAWLAWSLCAVCVVLIGLALLLDFLTDLIVMPRGAKTRPYYGRTNGSALAGIPDSRRTDRLAPPY